jgi:4-hydroxybenzoate polyprenyltransferase
MKASLIQEFIWRIKSIQPLLSIIYLASAGTLCIYSATHYLGQPINFFVGIQFMGIVASIYILNRFTDKHEDFANNVARYLFFRKYNKLYLLSICALILVSGALIFTRHFGLYHFLLIAFGILYSYKLIPGYKRGEGIVYYRLKDLPFIKNLVVSVLWGTAIFIIPSICTGYSISGQTPIYLLIGVLILSTFNNTTFCDIPAWRRELIFWSDTGWSSNILILRLLKINDSLSLSVASIVYTPFNNKKNYKTLLLIFKPINS